MTKEQKSVHRIANTEDPGRDADIVFIHGLGGSARDTWQHGRDGTDAAFYWPLELGKDRPHLGIWSVDYAAGLTAFGEPGMSIAKRAGNIALTLANADLGNRPLIFITHSMGGLIAKSLALRSQTHADTDAKRLAASLRGIVFCATPHSGSHYADFARKLGRFFGGSPKHVKEMIANDEGLDDLHEKFIEWRRRHNKIGIESYAESIGLFRKQWWLRPLSLSLGLVVDGAAANPKIEGTTVRTVDADHFSIVKPQNRQDAVYCGTLRFIDEVLSNNGETLRGRRLRELGRKIARGAPLTHDDQQFLQGELPDGVRRQFWRLREDVHDTTAYENAIAELARKLS